MRSNTIQNMHLPRSVTLLCRHSGTEGFKRGNCWRGWKKWRESRRQQYVFVECGPARSNRLCPTVSGVHHFLSSGYWSFHTFWTAAIKLERAKTSNNQFFSIQKDCSLRTTFVLTRSCEMAGLITWWKKRMAGGINLRMEENETTAFSRAGKYN